MLKTSPGDSSGQAGLAGFEKTLTGRDPDDAEVPRTVRRAVRLMLGGAAATLVVGLFLIIATIIDKNVLTDSSGKKLSNGEFTTGVVGTAITYIILIVIWVLMARFNRSGAVWARILASVFAAISTYDTYSLVNSITGGISITVVGIVYVVGSIVIWVFGVLAIAMLWRRESNDYFRSRTAARAAAR
jgi:hypothetical protein